MFCIPPPLIADTVPYGMILRGTKAAKVASKETRIVISKCTLAMACCEKRVPDYMYCVLFTCCRFMDEEHFCKLHVFYCTETRGYCVPGPQLKSISPVLVFLFFVHVAPSAETRSARGPLKVVV